MADFDEKKIQAFMDIGWGNAKAMDMSFGEYRVALERMLITAGWRCHEMSNLRTAAYLRDWGAAASKALIEGDIELSLSKVTVQ